LQTAHNLEVSYNCSLAGMIFTALKAQSNGDICCSQNSKTFVLLQFVSSF